MNAFYSKKVVIKPICKANTDLMFLLGSRYIEKFYNEFHCCNMIELEMVLSKIAKDMTGYVVYSRKTDELLGTMIFVHNKLLKTYVGFVVESKPDSFKGYMKKALTLLYGRKFFKEDAFLYLGVKPGDTRHQSFIDSVKNLISIPCEFADAKQYLFVI